MENVIEKYANKKSKETAKLIDDYFMKVMKAPNWIKKRRWLFKIYAKYYRFEIKEFRKAGDLSKVYLGFFIKGQKVGELELNI